MPRNPQTQAQLQAKINHLEKENVRLRTLFQMTLDIAYQAVNGQETEEKETNHE
jgi:cell shape-determining protein MreC